MRTVWAREGVEESEAGREGRGRVRTLGGDGSASAEEAMVSGSSERGDVGSSSAGTETTSLDVPDALLPTRSRPVPSPVPVPRVEGPPSSP